VRLLAALLLTATLAQAGVVSGVVFDARKTEPLSKATVTLHARAEPRRWVTTTDSRGVFEFQSIPEGLFDLRVERRGYLPFEAQPNETGPPVVEVPEEGAVEGLRVLLRLPGVLAGTVADEDGAGFAEAVVRARRIRVIDEQAETTFSAEAEADDRGDFRIYGLPPGTYLLDARPPDEKQPASVQVVRQPAPDDPYGQRLDDEVIPVFYPGARDPSQAAPLTLAAGEQRSGLYLRLETRPALTLSGFLNPGLRPDRFRLHRTGYAGTTDEIAPEQMTRQGEFRFRGLTPGAYVLAAEAGLGAQWRGAAQKLDVLDGSIRDYELRLVPAVPLRGKLSISARGLDADVRLTRVDLPAPFSVTGRVEPSGDVRFSRLLPGRYRLEASAYHPERDVHYYLKRARLDGRPAPDHEITVQGETESPNLFLSVELDEAGWIAGGVAVDEPEKLIAVLLDRQDRLEAVARVASNGRFLFEGIAPGERRVLALAGFNPDEHSGAAYWRNVWTRAAKVEVESGREVQVLAPALFADKLQ